MSSDESARGDLLAFARDGDPALLERLLGDAVPRAYRQARSLLGNAADAEQAVNDAGLQLVRTAARYDGTIPFAAWFGRLVHLACLRVAQTRRRRREVPLAASAAATGAGDAQEEAWTPDERVREAVLQLPERFRQAVVLHYFAGLDYRQTAEALGISVSNLGVRLLRARERLRRQLGGGRPLALSDHSLVLALGAPVAAPGAAAPDQIQALIGRICRPCRLPPGPAASVAGVGWLAAALATIAVITSIAGCVLVASDSRPSGAAPPPAGGTASGVHPAATDLEHLLRRIAGWQLADGRWQDEEVHPGVVHQAAGTTALALMPFLGAGYDQVTPNRFHQQVAAGLRWLVAHQRGDGTWSDDLTEQAEAVEALAEAYAMTGEQALEPAAAAAVAGLLARRSPTRFGLLWSQPQGGGHVLDTRLQCACLLALKSALAAGITADWPAVRTAGVAWLRETWQLANPGWRQLGHGEPSSFPAAVDALSGEIKGPGRELPAPLAAAVFVGIHRGDLLVDTLAHGLGQTPPADLREREFACSGLFQVAAPQIQAWSADPQQVLAIPGDDADRAVDSAPRVHMSDTMWAAVSDEIVERPTGARPSAAATTTTTAPPAPAAPVPSPTSSVWPVARRPVCTLGQADLLTGSDATLRPPRTTASWC